MKPDDTSKLSDHFTIENWNADKKEFDYQIIFPSKESDVEIMFEEMKTCSGNNQKIELLYLYRYVRGN